VVVWPSAVRVVVLVIVVIGTILVVISIMVVVVGIVVVVVGWQWPSGSLRGGRWAWASLWESSGRGSCHRQMISMSSTITFKPNRNRRKSKGGIPRY